MGSEPFLTIEHLSLHFAGVRAVNDVSFTVAEGEILGLIGPNGAGKTTTFNVISGRYRPTAGAVRLGATVLTGLRPDRIAASGVARTFQGTRIFTRLSVVENVATAVLARTPIGFWSGWVGTAGARRAQRAAIDEAMVILTTIGLVRYANDIAGSLAYAHQSLIGIGLALALKPRLLLLDEPFAGMNSTETMRGSEMVQRIRAGGVTVLLVEHDMAAVMGICDRIVVLDHGEKVTEGPPAAIRAHPEVIRAYLGEEIDA
jgi:branched-chain amino acid transport system ATP-binding protein